MIPSPYQVRTKTAPSPLIDFAVFSAKMQIFFMPKPKNPTFFSLPWSEQEATV